MADRDAAAEQGRQSPNIELNLGFFKLKITDNRFAKRVLTAIGITTLGTSLVVLFRSDPEFVLAIVRRALEGYLGLSVEDATPGSLIVDLHYCGTKETFLSFMEDFEKKKVKQRLEEEFQKVDYEVELEVTIVDEKEVYEKLDQIRKLEQEKSKEDKGKTPATVAEFTPEQLNYFRMTYLINDVLLQGLRTIFKREWDSRYKGTLGEWEDTPKNGKDFYGGESSRNKRVNAHLLATVMNGNRDEWDFSILRNAIVDSDSIGHGLSPTVREGVVDLIQLRNGFVHMPQAHFTDQEFTVLCNKVQGAFQSLGLSTQPIQNIRQQPSFPTAQTQSAMTGVGDKPHL